LSKVATKEKKNSLETVATFSSPIELHWNLNSVEVYSTGGLRP
jgi:hypothetical protein